ncbi:pyridoxamine 5'-phosphate oxidase family protein [Actinoplanes sp. NBC_00393]|uniref:pyridoxamine 5'-phosphate oxidase family protein n=1 Tax=Actinoplanes sp. NBC_00393 TaxID=2975953 RepID=UPI002E1C23FD
MNSPDPAGVARSVIESNLYMTLGTADETGTPWAAPVCYVAAAGHREFYWASRPEARHSRNLAVRPSLSVVIFDSQVPVYQGRAVYLEAVGEQLTGADLHAGIAIYNGPAAERGSAILERTDLEAPAPHRLYRATVVQSWILDGSDIRIPLDAR